MLSQHRIRSALLAAAVAVGCAAPTFAGTMPPQPVHQGKVTYITGGIGEAETQALKASARNYDLQISNAEKDGAFTAGADLVIRARMDMRCCRHAIPDRFFMRNCSGDYVIHALMTVFSGQRTQRCRQGSDRHSSNWPQAD